MDEFWTEYGLPTAITVAYIVGIVVVLLGAVALRTGETIYWNGPEMKANNLPEADPYIRGYFRKGWEI